MRLLHSRNDDARAGVPRSQPGRRRGANPQGADAEPLPLRHAHAHPARRGAGREIDGLEDMNAAISRRRFLASGSALVVSFTLSPALRAQDGAKLPGSLEKAPLLDSWIGVAGDGKITVLTGKAELGQGIRTALCQVAAEELGVPFERITLVTADTARTPDEGYTAGSNSMKDSGTAILNAAAQARELLVGEAAKKWSVAPGSLAVR